MRIDPPLPDIFLITPEPPESARFDMFLERLSHAVSSGVALVQLRAKRLDAVAYRELAERACAICHRHTARLILNGPLPLEDAQSVDADGVHLPSAQLMRCAARPNGARFKLLSAACHSREQLLHAQAIGVDFVTLSPVLPTASHPGEPTLGWPQFQALAAQVSMPVFALGGMTREALPAARACGAYGVAGISAFW